MFSLSSHPSPSSPDDNTSSHEARVPATARRRRSKTSPSSSSETEEFIITPLQPAMRSVSFPASLHVTQAHQHPTTRLPLFSSSSSSSSSTRQFYQFSVNKSDSQQIIQDNYYSDSTNDPKKWTDMLAWAREEEVDPTAGVLTRALDRPERATSQADAISTAVDMKHNKETEREFLPDSLLRPSPTAAHRLGSGWGVALPGPVLLERLAEFMKEHSIFYTLDEAGAAARACPPCSSADDDDSLPGTNQAQLLWKTLAWKGHTTTFLYFQLQIWWSSTLSWPPLHDFINPGSDANNHHQTSSHPPLSSMTSSDDSVPVTYSSAVNVNEEGNGPQLGSWPLIWVDVQRRKGSCIELQTLRQEIYQDLSRPVATTTHSFQQQRRCSSSSRRREVCPLIKKLYEQQEQELKQQEELKRPAKTCTDSKVLAEEDKLQTASADLAAAQRPGKTDLPKCCQWLKSRCFDQKRMGLENLLYLTDTRLVSMEVAQRASCCLIHWLNTDDDSRPQGEDDKDENSPDGAALRREFLSYFQLTHDGEDDIGVITAFDLKNDDAESSYQYRRYRRNEEMRSVALRILMNALEVTFTAKEKPNSADKNQASLELRSEAWELILNSLPQFVAKAASQPHEAAWALRCLDLILLRTGPNVLPIQQLLHNKLFLSNLSEAHQFGQAHDAVLERASQTLAHHLLTYL